MVNFRVRRSKFKVHEAEDMFGGLAEASFSTLLSRVAFLIVMWYSLDD